MNMMMMMMMMMMKCLLGCRDTEGLHALVAGLLNDVRIQKGFMRL